MFSIKPFVDRHASKIRGTLSYFDRVVITLILPDICHAEAMARHLGVRGIRLFDYPQFAQGFQEEIRARAKRLAQEAGPLIERETARLRVFGELSYDTVEEIAIIRDLYRHELRLHKNFFQPVMKLVDKERIGGSITRKYGTPTTPC
jgi:hypothetical protein